MFGCGPSWARKLQLILLMILVLQKKLLGKSELGNWDS